MWRHASPSASWRKGCAVCTRMPRHRKIAKLVRGAQILRKFSSLLLKNFKKFGMSQDRLIKLACSKCKRINYWSSKNKKLVERKIDLKKYCKWCKKHLAHKEVKK